MSYRFDYDYAFSRNLGWVSEDEQQTLRLAKVAVGGVGGCGGSYFLTLARLGVGRVHIADLDDYEMANFNRQVGATMETIGRPKVDAMVEMARNINPDMEIKVFPNGLDENNLDEFLDGVDLYLDGIDLFVIDIRHRLYEKLSENAIPAVFGAPMGMSAAYLSFMPGGMTFEEYYGLQGHDAFEQSVRFIAGTAPKATHKSYIADRSFVNIHEKRGPSIFMGVQLCAGAVITEALKILLGRGKVYAAPYYHQIDAYKNAYKRGKLMGGYKNPLHQIKLFFMRRLLDKVSKASRPPYPEPDLSVSADSNEESARIPKTAS